MSGRVPAPRALPHCGFLCRCGCGQLCMCGQPPVDGTSRHAIERHRDFVRDGFSDPPHPAPGVQACGWWVCPDCDRESVEDECEECGRTAVDRCVLAMGHTCRHGFDAGGGFL